MGMSSAEETTKVEGWINQYPEVKHELDEIEISLEKYASSFAVQPSASVKDKIFTSINTTEEHTTPVHNLSAATTDTKVYRLSSSLKALAAAMVILLLGSIVLNYIYFHKYQAANNRLQTATNNLAAAQSNLQTAQNDLKDVQEKMQEKQQVNAEMKNEMEVIGNKNSLPVVLKGTPHAPDAVAKIYWLKNSGEVYVDPTNLPNTPADKQYQLWAIVDGKPVSAGMISTKKGNYHIEKMKSFGSAQAFAITLEKAGGSEKPTMDQMYVISKVGI